MIFWIWFWKVFFIVTIAGFAGMSVWIAIGGYADLGKLFKKIDEEHRRRNKEP